MKSINSNLYISNNSNINGSVSLLSNLYVSGNCSFNNTYIGNNLNILAPNIYLQLSENLTNSDAANNGVPLWGFYRTGGILKIRLDTIPPVLTLNGNTTMNILINDTFIEPGLVATDNLDTNIIPYIKYIYNTSNTQLLSSYIYITQPTTLNIIDTTIVNTYTIIYEAKDSVGNIGTTNRIVNVNWRVYKI